MGNSADRFTKLENNPESGIDVIELNQSTAAKGYEEGLFDKLDTSKIENLKDLITPAKICNLKVAMVLLMLFKV